MSLIKEVRFLPRFFSSKPRVEFEIVHPTSADKGRVWEFLKEQYYPYEPMAQCLGGEIGKIEKNQVLESLDNGLTIVAVEKKSNKIIGVAMNDVFKKKSEAEIEELIKECDKYNDNYKWVIKCFEKIDKDGNFWSRIGTDSCLRNAAICSDKSYRNMGIASALLRKTLSVSKKYKFLRGESTEIFSFGVLQKLGFEILQEMDFQDFRDEKGNVIFNTKPPNTRLRLMIKELNFN